MEESKHYHSELMDKRLNVISWFKKYFSYYTFYEYIFIFINEIDIFDIKKTLNNTRVCVCVALELIAEC